MLKQSISPGRVRTSHERPLLPDPWPLQAVSAHSSGGRSRHTFDPENWTRGEGVVEGEGGWRHTFNPENWTERRSRVGARVRVSRHTCTLVLRDQTTDLLTWGEPPYVYLGPQTSFLPYFLTWGELPYLGPRELDVAFGHDVNLIDVFRLSHNGQLARATHLGEREGEGEG